MLYHDNSNTINNLNYVLDNKNILTLSNAENKREESIESLRIHEQINSDRKIIEIIKSRKYKYKPLIKSINTDKLIELDNEINQKDIDSIKNYKGKIKVKAIII